MAAKVTESEAQFLTHNGPYFEQARMGFLHGMPPSTLPEMERIYRAYLDPHFVLTQWCSVCVVDMMVRLSRWWEGVQAEEEAAALATMAGQDTLDAISAPLAAEVVTDGPQARPKDTRPRSRRARPHVNL